jgi:hypothetical protein
VLRSLGLAVSNPGHVKSRVGLGSDHPSDRTPELLDAPKVMVLLCTSLALQELANMMMWSHG